MLVRSQCRLVLIVVIAGALGLGPVSCARKGDTVSSRSKPTGRIARLRVSGSGTALPLLRILTDRYSRLVPGGDVSFVYLPGLHSGGGVKGVVAGDLEIGAVSRELTKDERGLHLKYVLLSDDGLAIAVHPSVGISGVTTQQVREIYSGKFANWKELGGADLPITVLDRNEDESAKIILRKYVLGSDLDVTPRAVDLYYESDMIEGLQTTPGAIGYFSLGYGLSQNVSVEYLTLDGVAPTVANIESGAYRVVRPLGVVARTDASVGVDRFLTWASGVEAAGLMERAGFVPARR